MPTAAASDPSRGFRELAEAVEVPFADLDGSGSAVAFEAWVDAPGTPAGELLLHGTVWRLRSGALDAWSLLCPHEICEVERVTDPGRVPQQTEALPAPPLLACPCHFSIFDPERGGERVTGPAPRGLYRFGFEVLAGRVRIDRVEAALVDRFTVADSTPGGVP